MAADRFVLRLAQKLDASYAARYAEYEDECRADYAEGHRPHYCEHGLNLWVDHDPICGYCEDGESASDPFTRRRMALAEAHVRVDRYLAICLKAGELTALNVRQELVTSILNDARDRMFAGTDAA